MLDQAFSPQNFRQIYDRENRRGRNVDRRFFPDLVIASASISAASAKVRDCRRDGKHLSKTDLAAALGPLQAALDAARADRDALVDHAMREVSGEASVKGFQLSLTQTTGPNSTQLYPLVESPAAYFVGKQLQSNLSRLYKIKPSDRRKVVRQVKDILSTSFNLMVVRTDISSFYESIDRSILVNDLDKDQLLSLASKSHVKCVLMKYAQASGQATGIPRGVGISAYLSELFMRTVDEHIRQIDGLTYYARYVDDIIAIFSPTAMDDRSGYLGKIADAVALRGLTLNQAKTKSGPVASGTSFSFEYLGYDFTFAGGTCELELSSKKTNRYKKRLDAAFGAYSREARKDQKGAGRSLVARVKFMTGNTRLANSKGFAFTGIYYSNSELTTLGKLSGLDAYLAYKNASLSSASLQDRVCQHSFKEGFLKRPFYRYGTRAIAEIVKVWSYEA
jgi:hypothetical protein